jgi:glyoxylate reductase
LTRPSVFVPDRVLPRVAERLDREFDLVCDLAACPEGILATLNVTVNDAYLEAAGPRLKIVANYAVGVNNIDLESAARRGLVVANTPDVLTAATAELAVTLMLSLLRRAVEGDRLIRSGTQWQFSLDFMLGDSLNGKTLGIVGPGRIGRETARLASAFGAETIFAGRNEPLHELLEQADIVSLHCPLTPDTHHLIDATALDCMRSHAILINTSRGPVVDEAALVEALAKRRIAGAALDVFEFEPQVTERLRDFENVVLTPHLGSGTQRAREDMGFLAVDALRAVLIEGRLPANRVVPAPTASQ